MPTNVAQALGHLTAAATHLRAAVDHGEVDPVDAVNCESLLIGWKRDAALLTDITQEKP